MSSPGNDETRVFHNLCGLRENTVFRCRNHECRNWDSAGCAERRLEVRARLHFIEKGEQPLDLIHSFAAEAPKRRTTKARQRSALGAVVPFPRATVHRKYPSALL
ncbi:hypothetical protein ABIB82_007903 [Bradyrhizobium sp. i1.8.4]